MPTFAEPFEMMEACHERVHRMLDLLRRLREHLPGHGADEQARQAARDVMKYFDQAAPQHHRDEELHVFPPLLASASDEVVATVSRLQLDHVQMETRWADVRVVLDGIARGEITSLAPVQEAALDGFASIYDGHIAAEEKIAYPAARAMLDATTVKAMGEEMAGRRGVKL
ncbi:hemerythrin domain-containing protein [Ramlibacter albus]|uniref:Hemerythrin domain-containing protein n=1 Tax=Ramlibacter albus TaxID=2079448 RepID=A0A923MAR0_9BURK|nr:hemerythrin domain-containing protein [Ramlibacter albus]MBC5766968.1 hemerythrin domain-containing protein [Ramlibacter albus]